MKTRTAILPLLALVALAGDWPRQGLDGARSRTSPETVGTAWTLQWSYPVGFVVTASPAAEGGRVFVADTAGWVTAVRALDGTFSWNHSAMGPIETSPLVARGRVIFGDARYRLQALDWDTGSLLWDQPGGGTLLSSPLDQGSTFIAGGGLPANRAASFDLATGSPVWTASFAQPVLSTAATDGATVYIASSNGVVKALDAASGVETWSYAAPGTIPVPSPLLSGSYLYVCTTDPSIQLLRIHTDPAQWGTNWATAALSDPSPPGGAVTSRAVGSPVEADGRIFFLARFDHKVVNTYTSNEYLFAFDASTGAAVGAPFPLLLGTVTGDSNARPQARYCPTPAVAPTPAGNALVVASSVSATARLVRASDGFVLTSVILDGGSLASPLVANGRIYFATYPGTLWCFGHDANDSPTAPAAYSPSGGVGVVDDTPTLSWSGATDANDGAAALTYLVRWDDDGDVLREWVGEFVTGAGVETVDLPGPLADLTHVTWRVRAADPAGAMSEWSDPQDFWVVLNTDPPEPPSNLTATPGDAQVTLSWTATPSVDLKGYAVATQAGAGPWGSYVYVGNVTTTTVTGLTNGVFHTFRVVARDLTDLDSTPLEASATPLDAVLLNGTPATDLPTAVTAAVPGDTIQLGYGPFNLAATLGLREGVDLIGLSAHETWLVGNGIDPVIQLIPGALPRGRIAMLTIAGSVVGIETNGFAVLIENDVIRDMDTGVIVDAGSDALVKNDTFVNNASYGVYNASTLGAVRNGLFDGNGIGVSCAPGASIAPAYCDFYNVGVSSTANCGAGVGNLSVAVAYADAAASDYREAAGSAAVDGGDPSDAFSSEPTPNGSRVNLGAYGNTVYAATSPPSSGGGAGGGGGGGGGCWSGDASGSFWAAALLVILAAAACRRVG